MPGITRKTKALTIPSGATGLSAGIYLGAQRLQTIFMPGTWVAAVLTFQASADGGITWSNVYDNGTELSYTVDTSRAVVVDPSKFRGLQHIKLRSGTAAAPVDQTADRALTLITVPVER